jgi:serine/threonine protein kinase
MTLEAGRQSLHYRLIQKIGEGGMGVVWKAEDMKLHRHVALKVLAQSMAADPDRRARFERQARAVAALFAQQPRRPGRTVCDQTNLKWPAVACAISGRCSVRSTKPMSPSS